MNRRDLLILGGGALLASGLPARAQAPRVLQGPAFGSSWKLVADIDAADAAALTADIEAVVASVDAKMSPFRADSELSRFNRAATTGWQALSHETCAVVAEALRVAEATGDAFNPTLGPVTGRYGFGPIIEGVPGAPEEISVREGGVGKARAALTLDLCGIAKGHALDRMAAACAGRGLADVLIELGGEVLARGRHPSGRGWRVGVEGPSGFAGAVSLDGAALATSGIAVNAFSHGGRRYAHIVDPLTKRPADSALFSVTVAAGTAMTADALATALFAMGAARGPAFSRENGIEALFVMDDGATVMSGGFEARILG
jgi:thiamine biosynthesis lipoprotein